ncbi:MAG: hypothetical protein ACRCTP_04200 [Aeromonas popoffii]|uniref:hypothetical protein n=1 Tax=Aeromonas popoffii TaxID=70856 RepID=UPI003F3FDC0D
MNNVSFTRLAMVNLEGVSIPFGERPFVLVEGPVPTLATEDMLVTGSPTEHSTLEEPIALSVHLWRLAKEGSWGKTKNSGDLANELGQGLRCLMDEREVECLLAGLKGGTCS